MGSTFRLAGKMYLNSYKQAFININVKKRREKSMKERVEKVIDKIRPALQADGGNIELVDVIDGIVKVRLM